jgi:uncharacterized protein YoxC
MEVEKDIPELHRRIESVAQKIPLVEQSVQRQQTRIEEAIQAVKGLEKPIEELRVSDFQREQKVRAYLGQAQEVAEELERIREQTHGFLERREQVKRALNALEKFKTRIERRQDERAERQRVARERVDREWEEWQAERVKEIKKREIVIEQRWQSQEEVDRKQQNRLGVLEETTKLHQGQLGSLWEIQRSDANAVLSSAQDLYERLIAPIDEKLAVLRGEAKE